MKSHRNLKNILQILALGLLLSCSIQNPENKNNSQATKADTAFYWHVVNDTVANSEFINKGKLVNSITENRMAIIDILNQRNLDCKIQFVETSSDTIVIHIENDEVLTEQMGTSGAFCFMAEIVFSLTELENINHVKFQMDEGSHAAPGIYRRDDFKELIKE